MSLFFVDDYRTSGHRHMIESNISLAIRVRKELVDLNRLILRANRAIEVTRKHPKDDRSVY